MNGGNVLLFFTRLAVYLAAVSLPLVHPGIAVAYDLPAAVLWFVIVPYEAAAAFFLRPPRLAPRVWIAAAVLPLFAAAFLASGFTAEALSFVAVGAAAFVLTAALFGLPRIGRHLALLEQVFLVFVAYRMLSFSRASEDMAAETGALTQGILVFAASAFLLHGMVVYHAVYGSGGRRKRREIAVFALAAAAALVLLTVVLPPDFVKNSVVSNLLQDEVRPEPVPVDADGDGIPDGNLRSPREGGDGGRRLFPWNRDGRRGGNRLEGIPQNEWPGTGRGQGGEDKQYAVMVAAGRRDPLYAAGEYRGRFDPLRGFLRVESSELNELARVRLLETWIDTGELPDLDRSETEVYFLSTMPERYLPYKPLSVEPTILHREYGPFRYSYRAVSRMSSSGPREWRDARDLDPMEREALAEYLDVPLAENDLAVFDAYIRGAVGEKTGYFEKIAAILEGFSAFQYNLGFDEDTSVPALVEFLTLTKEGDCTEFSNAAAVLGRLAGIPSRVVTGYLASGELQTPAHVRGLMVLRNAVKPLQDFPLEELFLVTTAHRHSWVQFFVPDYGWIDFEATSSAIPPAGFGDPNNRDVVIPLLEEDPSLTPIAVFPWRKVLRGAALLAAFLVAAAYLLRYGREAWLALRSRGSDDRAVRAVYRLLLMRLAAEGRPFKPAAKTSGEYARLFPEEPAFAAFAALYTGLRYRERFAEGERQSLAADLRREYAAVTEGLRRPGVIGAAKRIFSLRGLWYL